MGAVDPLQALQAPGQLYINPTTVDPVDGTLLGLKQSVTLRYEERRISNTAEEFGGEAADDVFLGIEWRIAFALRGFDNDAIQALFPNTSITTTTNTNKRGVNYPGSELRVGQSWSTKAVKLLFVPDDPDQHGVYFRSAIPLTEPTPLVIAFGRPNEALIAVAFKALRDETTEDDSVQVRLVEDIVL